MKLLHLADLHFGKRLYEFSMLEDQAYIWQEICGIIEREKPDGVILAGDIYDKSVPSAEAVELFDRCLSQLASYHIPIFIISGNHDSAERVAYGRNLFEDNQVYVSPIFEGKIKPITYVDNFGIIRFYLLPFVHPAQVRPYYPDEEIHNYADAIRVILDHIELDPNACNVLITHQAVVGAEMFGTEERPIGNLDLVPSSLFSRFTYTALGHIHKAQAVGGNPCIRYAGSPLKYSISEIQYDKTVTMVDLRAPNQVYIQEIPLHPKRDLREVRGTFHDLMKNPREDVREDYIHVVLTDEDDVPDAIQRLREIYPWIIKLDYDNTRTQSYMQITEQETAEEDNPLELLEELYKKQNNEPMDKMQRDIVQELLEKIAAGEEK